MPEGFIKRMTIRITKAKASLYSVETYAAPMLSMRPRTIPPSIAPLILPMPPSTAAVNQLIGNGFTNNQRPLISGQGCTSGLSGAQVLNPQAVTLIGYAIGTVPQGIEPRGYCHGPGTVNTDLSIDKNWRVWGERMRIQFRMDFFNLFNHANFRGDQINGVNGGTTFQNVNCGAVDVLGKYQPCSPSNNIITRQTYNSNAGYAVSTKGARELQYGLKIIF